MRRLASLAVTSLLLTGCHYASSPLDGFGGFVTDTHLYKNNPNKPAASSENLLRVQGQSVAADPLLPEPGNIWPGPPAAGPTLEDAIKAEQTDQIPGSDTGVSGSVPYGSAAHPQPRPGVTMTPATPITVPPPSIDTSRGAQPLTQHGNGIATTTTPGGGTSIVVPNGNGTSTIIGPDGSTQTVPTAH